MITTFIIIAVECFVVFFLQIEADISKRYNKRPVNLMGVNI